MYRIANVTDRSGKIQKPERIGRLIYEPRMEVFTDGLRRMFAVYADRDKLFISSPILMDTWDYKTGDITVVTENSIYTLERVGN